MTKAVLVALLAIMGASCVPPKRPQTLNAPPPKSAPPTDGVDGGDRSEEGDAKDAAEFFLMRRVSPGETTLPLDRYVTARQQATLMPAVSLADMGARAFVRKDAAALAGNSWTSLGPGNVGGRTRSLVINPQDPNIMYAGAVTGGVWKSTDGGRSWAPLTDFLPVLNIGALVMDPNDPNTLYAGTGEWYTFEFPGQGIFKTRDAGVTWALLPNTGSNVTVNFQFVNRLVMSPSNPGRIYAATSTGVFTSPDGGNTWTPTALNTGQVYAGCQDLVIRTDRTADYLFASCSGTSIYSNYAIWRNTNAAGGGVWSQVFTASFMGRTSLALAPSQQSTIYAMAASYDSNSNYAYGLLAVYRSMSNGDAGSWTTQVANTDPNITNTLLLQDIAGVTGSYCSDGPLTFSNGQGDWDNALAVDPLDSNRVWAGGIGAFRSDDGGVTWGVASLHQIAPPQYAHEDEHLFVFHPGYNGTSNQSMYMATDGGVFRTDNARAAVSTGPKGACVSVFTSAAAIQWFNLNSSYVATQYYHGFAYPGGKVYVGGAQDNGVSRGTDLAGINGYSFFSGGDGGSVAVDPADANTIFQSIQYLSLRRATDGSNFISATSGITEKYAHFPFIAYLAMDPNEGKRLFLGGTTNLWRSMDGAVSWTAAAPVEPGSSVQAIVVSPFDSNTVLFGTQLGYIYRNSAALTSNASAAWTGVRPRSGFVASLAFDPTNPNRVYAVYSSAKSAATDAHVYRSTNGGVTWTPSDGSGNSTLPDIPVFRLIVNPHNPSQLFVGTDLGVFVSPDGGDTWARDTSLENVIVEELALDQGLSSNWLFAFTHGRGVYRVPLPNSPSVDCTYSVSPTSISVDAFGAVIPVTVTAPAGCAWVALPGTVPAPYRDIAFNIQSPAQGTGTGTAFVVVTPLDPFTKPSDPPLTDHLEIANTSISVTQSPTTANTYSADSPTAATPLNIPGIANIDSRGLTSSPSDPILSCSGSAGYKTAWWIVTPTSSGYLQARAYGRRYDVEFGNSGIVVTAFAQSAPTKELACAIVPRDTTSAIDGIIQFPVTAGSNYLIEVAATGPTAQDGGYTVVVVTQSGPPASVSVTPATATLTAGSCGLQFSAQVSNASNSAVRWSISPPIGTISTSGLYSPPSSASAPAIVTVTATSFADNSMESSAVVQVVPASGSPVQLDCNAAPNLVPQISPGGVVGAGLSFPPVTQLSSNAIVSIFGQNFAPTGSPLAMVGSKDLVGGNLPTKFADVCVEINSQRAPLFVVTPGQLNLQVPSLPQSGKATVQVITNCDQATETRSAAATVSVQAATPEFFFFAHSPDGRNPIAAINAVTAAYVGTPNLIPGTTFIPARPGDFVSIFMTGLGATTPSDGPGVLAPGAATVDAPVSVTLGTMQLAPGNIPYVGVAPGNAGLYQLNIQIPPGAPTGNVPLAVTVGAFSTPPGGYLTIGQ